VELVRVELDCFIVISNDERHMNDRLPHQVYTSLQIESDFNLRRGFAGELILLE